MLETQSLPKISRASSHKDVFGGLWGSHDNEKKMQKLSRNKSMVYGRMELDEINNKSSKSIDLRKKRNNDLQDYTLANAVLIVVDEATRNAQMKDIKQDINYLIAGDGGLDGTWPDANSVTSLLVAGDKRGGIEAQDESPTTPSESIEEKSPLMLSYKAADEEDEDEDESDVESIEEEAELFRTKDRSMQLDGASVIPVKQRDYLFTDQKHSSEPILWSTTTPPTAVPLARSASHAVSHKDWLMEEKTKAIKRLESMGYDPYKGVYVAHRKRLMEEKTKAVNRMEILGYDPYKGVYCAHRGALMKEKDRALARLGALGFDACGKRKQSFYKSM